MGLSHRDAAGSGKQAGDRLSRRPCPPVLRLPARQNWSWGVNRARLRPGAKWPRTPSGSVAGSWGWVPQRRQGGGEEGQRRAPWSFRHCGGARNGAEPGRRRRGVTYTEHLPLHPQNVTASGVQTRTSPVGFWAALRRQRQHRGDAAPRPDTRTGVPSSLPRQGLGGLFCTLFSKKKKIT